MDGRTEGQLKQAAARTGVTVEEWKRLKTQDIHWCFDCRKWKQRTQFHVDKSRASGLQSRCKPCISVASVACSYSIPKAQAQSIKNATKCPICGRVGKNMNVDHCHKTGRVRGPLCARCNRGLGMFCDDPNLLRAAISYLQTNS